MARAHEKIRMALSESLQQQALRELGSQSCVCGNEKKKGESFCRQCYFGLPKGLRNRLYRTFSEGYPEIYDEAKDWLRENTSRLDER